MIASFLPLAEEHRESVMKIYNHYVEEGSAAFPSVPQPPEAYDRFLEIGRNYPAYAVLDSSTGEVAGFCLLSGYLPHDTFCQTACLTYFLAPDCRGRGLGSECLRRLEQDARALGIRELIADISSENSGSLRFHERHGFTAAGELKRIGRKHGTEFGLILMQKSLRP